MSGGQGTVSANIDDNTPPTHVEDTDSEDIQLLVIYQVCRLLFLKVYARAIMLNFYSSIFGIFYC